MPRIGGGGGPIPPQTTGTNQSQQTNQSQKSNFADSVAAQQGTDGARFQQAKQAKQSQLTGKTREIAKRLAGGELTQREATREFVGLVIEERFPQFKRKKKKKNDDDEPETQEEMLEEAVTELIDRDPVLAKQLETQFKKLAVKA